PARISSIKTVDQFFEQPHVSPPVLQDRTKKLSFVEPLADPTCEVPLSNDHQQNEAKDYRNSRDEDIDRPGPCLVQDEDPRKRQCAHQQKSACNERVKDVLRRN